MFKNWAPWKENRVLRGASKLLVLVFIFSRARDPRSKFFSVLSRGTCVDSCPLCLSLPPPSISESHTLAITLRTCFTGEKTVFLRFSRGRGSRWRTAPACGLPRSLVISREIVFGAPEQFRDPPRVSENILPSKFTRKSISSSPLFFFLERNCLLYLIRRDGTSSISSKLVSRWYTNHAYGNVFSWDIARGRSHVGE